MWQQARPWKPNDVLLIFVFLDDASTVKTCNVISEHHVLAIKRVQIDLIPGSRKPENDKISKRTGVRVVVDYSKFDLLTLQAILNPYLGFIFGKYK